MNIKQAIAKVVERENLSEAEMTTVFGDIMSGETSPAQIGAFITALRMKGETIDEIVGATRAMRAKATFVDTGLNTDQDILADIVGTGGDGSGSFNVSTTSAFVVAAGGIHVAKHGNRAVSSRCGAADVLEALGVNLDLSPERVAASVATVGIGFLFSARLRGFSAPSPKTWFITASCSPFSMTSYRNSSLKLRANLRLYPKKLRICSRNM